MTVDPRRLPVRHRPAALLATVVAVGIADWLWLAGPRQAAHAASRERLAIRRAEVEAARREAAARADTRQAVHATARALRRAAARLPDDREVSALLAAVAERASEAGLVLHTVRPLPERPAADHVEVPVELEVRGAYHDTRAFLRGLERLGRLVHVAELRLGQPERVGDGVVLAGRCTAITYRLLGEHERRPAAGQAAEEQAR